MKYLGIDFGTKKVGIANSDEEGRLAFPMMICPNDKSLMIDILEIVRAMKISTVVVGESLDSQGKPNPVAKLAREFAIELEYDLPNVKIVFEKEWYSSMEARRIDGERDVDDRAAAIILQRYLDRVNGPIDDINTDEEEEEEE